MRPTNLLPDRLRRYLLALAEIGHETHRDLKLALLARRRSVFLDVGANRGQFARFMASFYDRVVVFEPLERFEAELKAVLAPNCIVHRCALADLEGSATFYVPSESDPLLTQTASLIAPGAGASHSEVAVQVQRLDDFAFGVRLHRGRHRGRRICLSAGCRRDVAAVPPGAADRDRGPPHRGATRRVFDVLAGLGYRAFIAAPEPDRRGSSAFRRVLRGMAYTLAPRRIALLPIDHLLEHVHAGSATLNESFGATYVNNFLFLPADLRVSGRHGSLAFPRH